MSTIVAALDRAVEGGTLVMPTFTYSFCRGERFDVAETPSTVGALTEHFRRLPGVRRTFDPLFSAAVRGPLPARWEESFFRVRDTDSFGPESVFACLRETGAKLLFFGVGFEYATFVHHAEQRMGVPYRFLKNFRGEVRAGDDAGTVTARYFVRDLEGDVEPYFDPLADALLTRGGASSASIQRGPSLFLTDAAAVEATARDRVGEHPDFLLRRGHARPPAPER